MRRLLLPAILCMGSSLLLGPIRADQVTTTVTTDSKVDLKNQMSASQVLHSRVVDRSGQKIGDVEDLVLDPTSGRIQFAVLKLSGDLADNGKYTPVPFTLLKPSDTTKKDMFGHQDLILQTDRDKLLSGSKFNIKSWPDRDHVVLWGPDVYAHYGVPWDTTIGRGATGTTFESSTGTDQSRITIREPGYRYRYEYTTDMPKPIDNGTGPDGKDTFHFSPRPWPYSEYPPSQQE